MSAARERDGTRRGGDPARVAPSARSWRDRVDDPDEPLFTMAVAADLLGLDTQALRRLAATIDQAEARPSGNQRRFSRTDLERLSAAVDLVAQGHSGHSLSTILELTERRR
ncbi:MAG: MerR family transcriptional regulator [Acidimicrobiales bacterium]